jgi:hypothetical protein
MYNAQWNVNHLNFAIFMHVTRMSVSGLSVVSRNRGSSWNVLPVGTGELVYLYKLLANLRERLKIKNKVFNRIQQHLPTQIHITLRPVR